MNYDNGDDQNLNQDILNDIDEIDFSMANEYNRAEIDNSLCELIEGLSLLSIDSDDNGIELETRNIKKEKPSAIAQNIVGVGETIRKTYSINMLEEGIKSGEISEIDLSNAIDRDLTTLGIDDKIDVNMYLANPYTLPVENILDVMAVQSALTGVPLNVLMGIEIDENDDSLSNLSRDIAEEDIRIKKSFKDKINNTKSKSLVDKVIVDDDKKDKKKPKKDKKLEKMMTDFEKEKQKIIDKGLVKTKKSNFKLCFKKDKIDEDKVLNSEDKVLDKPEIFENKVGNKDIKNIHKNVEKSKCNLKSKSDNYGSEIEVNNTLQDDKENLGDEISNYLDIDFDTDSNLSNSDITDSVDSSTSHLSIGVENQDYVNNSYLEDNFNSEEWFDDTDVNVDDNISKSVNEYAEEDFNNTDDFKLFVEDDNKPNYSLGGDDIVDYPLTNKIMGVPNSKVYSLDDISQRVSDNERLDVRRGVKR